MRVLLLAVIVLFSGLLLGQDIELRMVNYRLIETQLSVDIDMRGSSSTFILADHNLPLFYDNQQLALDKVVSRLTSNYASPVVEEEISNSSNPNRQVLAFEDHMTFLNISTLMSEKKSKGIEITPEWSPVYTLVFEVLDLEENITIAWAMDGVTDQYATSFVNVAEWNGPNEIKSLRVFDLINFQQKIEGQPSVAIDNTTIVVTPNPATDFIMIEHGLNHDLTYSLIDMNGQTQLTGHLDSMRQIPVSQMRSGAYILLLEYGDDQSHAEQIMIEKP